MTADRPRLWRDANVADTATPALREAMHGSINYANRAPMCCSDGIETAHEIKPSRVPWGIVIVAIVSIGLIACIFGYANRKPANAAERPGAYEIVAYPAGKDLREDRPNLVVIAGPFGREECRIAIASVKLANGSRLRCDAVDNRRVR